ncbi:MAG: hypothetical protein HQ583_09660 [Candidatus Abyssubacteria bacterium]|nr:hypothetical protein [Candidatus Abyssubacteria bacterium]
MPKKKRKKKKSKTKKAQTNISDNANPVRFFIFLAIGLILLAAFFYVLFIKGGF